jgi:hypothetical protein
MTDQVARNFRAMVALTGISVVVAMMFLAIFAAFGRADIGAILSGVLLGPVVVLAWLDFAILRFRAARHSPEKSDFETTDDPSG